MKTLQLFIFFALSCCQPAFAGHRHTERWYEMTWAPEVAGRTEVRLANDTRADVVTPKHAVEIDFAAKWHECLGQALDYASQTGLRPTTALIVEHPSEERFVEKLRGVIAWLRRTQGLEVDVVILKPLNKDGLEMTMPASFHDLRRVNLRQSNTDLPKSYQ